MVGGAERQRLEQDRTRQANWKRWGPYLSERQWGTVREDYSSWGNTWEYFDFEASQSRAYRWGEDGLLGITDRECRLCFGLALWNGQDTRLKERLFGVTNHQGNHGEDVKEFYFYLDCTPTHSYMKALYKYPQNAFPYDELINENKKRQRDSPEFELADSGILAENRYFDVQVEYAKATADDILIAIEMQNHGPQTATLHLLPTLWFRNTWAWGRSGDGYWPKPALNALGKCAIVSSHETLDRFVLAADPADIAALNGTMLFTDNETNNELLFNAPNRSNYVKDGFHNHIISGQPTVNRNQEGTKAAFHFVIELAPGEKRTVRLRLKPVKDFAGPEELTASFSQEMTEKVSVRLAAEFAEEFHNTLALRKQEADEFYDSVLPTKALAGKNELGRTISAVMRQAYSGLLWNKQFYYYVVSQWLEGDPNAPPPQRRNPSNKKWRNIFNRDIILMPDKWEYPWYAIWDLAFHVVVMAKLDGEMAKEQIILVLREWYMHPNGQLPAYEFDFSDLNPPVHAWAAFRVYKMTAPRNERDTVFLARAFQKLLLNFTWWVNRKDIDGNDLFGGGFLGLDNIGVFDRSRGVVPLGGQLEQADGTAWMSFYCTTMLGIALELSATRPAYDDIASKFFEHFVQISDAMHKENCGLWCEDDGFYYDRLLIKNGTGAEDPVRDKAIPLKLRSIVGLIPILAVEILNDENLKKLPGFYKRMQWFIDHRDDLDGNIALTRTTERGDCRLLSLLNENRLRSLLRYMLDENEFLSPYGIRSLSKIYENSPYIFRDDEDTYEVRYVPGDSDTGAFGGNSNWRGPIWLPINFLIVEALERYHRFYGPAFLVECPTGSGKMLNLEQVADEIAGRLAAIFTQEQNGLKPWQNEQEIFKEEAFKDKALFYEYFHAESGKGLGASHQTGWTALITRIFDILAKR